MKERILTVLLALALLLCGCTPQREEISQPESSESSSVESTPEQSTPEVSEEITFLRENFPRIDGSTSLIPLEAGVRAAIFGKSFDEAQKDVVHSTTWGSFKRLLSGDADIIFSGLAKEAPGVLRDKVSQSQNSGRKATRRKRRHPNSAWKSAGKSWIGQRKSWQNRSRPKSRAR